MNKYQQIIIYKWNQVVEIYIFFIQTQYFVYRAFCFLSLTENDIYQQKPKGGGFIIFTLNISLTFYCADKYILKNVEIQDIYYILIIGKNNKTQNIENDLQCLIFLLTKYAWNRYLKFT